jgi:hypothetical protein
MLSVQIEIDEKSNGQEKKDELVGIKQQTSSSIVLLLL